MSMGKFDEVELRKKSFNDLLQHAKYLIGRIQTQEARNDELEREIGRLRGHRPFVPNPPIDPEATIEPFVPNPSPPEMNYIPPREGYPASLIVEFFKKEVLPVIEKEWCNEDYSDGRP